MFRLSLTKSIALLLGSITLAIILITVLIGIPSIRHILHLRDDVETTQITLSNDFSKTQRLRRSLKDVKAIFAQIQPLQYIVIEHGKELDVITQLENIATNNHVTQDLDVAFVDPRLTGKAQPQGGTALREPHYLMTFSSEGTTYNLLNYLQALEHLPYYITIDRLEWSNNKNTKAATVSNVRLRFTGFILVNDLQQATSTLNTVSLHRSTAAL